MWAYCMVQEFPHPKRSALWDGIVLVVVVDYAVVDVILFVYVFFQNLSLR